MARLAGSYRLDVVLVLACCDFIVVAAEAIVGDRTMVHMHLIPVGGIVTFSTGFASGRVVFRLALGHVAVVAFLAGRRHALEDRTFMAGLARYRLVDANQIKCGGGVVKIAVNLDGRIDLFGPARRAGKYKHRDEHHDAMKMRGYPA